MRVCPKCGHERTARDDAFVARNECPKCGIVYEKFAEAQKLKDRDREHGQVREPEKKRGVFSTALLTLVVLALALAARSMLTPKRAVDLTGPESKTIESSIPAASTTRSVYPEPSYSPAPSPGNYETGNAGAHQVYEGSKELAERLNRLIQERDRPLTDSDFFRNHLTSYRWENVKSEPNYRKIQTILYSYHRQHTYMGHELFVCLDMAMDVWNLLTTAGIKAKLMVGNATSDITDSGTLIKYVANMNHAWVMAEVAPSSWVPLETTGGFIVEPSMRNFQLYNMGAVFENPRDCKEFNEYRKALFEVCNETFSMAGDFNRQFAGKPATVETTEYTGRMKQKLDDCERSLGRVVALMQRR